MEHIHLKAVLHGEFSNESRIVRRSGMCVQMKSCVNLTDCVQSHPHMLGKIERYWF